MAKTTYKVAPKMATARKNNGGEDPNKKGPGPTPLPGGLKAPSSTGPEKYVSPDQKIKNTSERFKKEPNYNVKDAAKRGKGNIENVDKDLKNTRSRMGSMYQEGKINRRQLKDSIRSTMDVGKSKSDIRSKVKEVGGRTKAGQVLYSMSGSKNKAKGGGLTMKAETRSRSCSKPGKGF